jgi:DNA (cytosine-5)-methyltransferase 1
MMRANKVISLFAGAGGMDIGFRNAGFDVVVAVEQDSSCCDTLRANNPKLSVLEGDIRELPTELIMKQGGLKPLEAALVIGGPPCQSFSLAGKRMGLDDPRGMLLLQFSRVVKEALPLAFVLENVKGMVNWSGGKALDAVIEEFTHPIEHENKTYKYEISYKVLKASSFGVPQHRERLFMVGNRVGKSFDFPKPQYGFADSSQPNLFESDLKPYRTVQDAIGSLPPADEPSEMAIRISSTIKGRIEKYGY